MNPYTPPTALVADPPAKPGSPTKAICLGLLVDIGGTILSGTIFGILYAMALTAQGMSPEEATTAIQESTQAGWGFAAMSAMGGAFSVLGGFVCARISRRTNYQLGWVMSGISVALGALVGWSSYTLAQHALLASLTAASILFGMKLGMPSTEA
jgi:MFS family permease